MIRNRSLTLSGVIVLAFLTCAFLLLALQDGRTAGATREHPHWQLIATPTVPKRVLEELQGVRKYYSLKGRCVYCDIIDEELRERKRLVCCNDRFDPSNDLPEEAVGVEFDFTPLGEDEFFAGDLRVSPGHDDWFGIELNPGCMVEVTVKTKTAGNRTQAGSEARPPGPVGM